MAENSVVDATTIPDPDGSKIGGSGMRKTKKQIWFCDVCGKRGTAKYKEGDDIYTVLHLIEDSHRLTSPKCMQSTSHIRVITKNTSKEIVDEIMRRPTA